MTDKEKRAAASIFQSNDRVKFELPKHDEVDTLQFAGKKETITYYYQDSFQRAGQTFLNHHHKNYVQGNPHTLAHGYPKIGFDILFIEFSTSRDGVFITDAIFAQNAIPKVITRFEVDSIRIELAAFMATNEAIFELAGKYIEVQQAAKKASEAEQPVEPANDTTA